MNSSQRDDQHRDSLKEFTSSFFHYFDSTVKEISKGEKLQVTLNGELAEQFRRETLDLAFHQHSMDDSSELVATGSRIFDQMLSHLDGRSALTLQQLPAHYPAGEELLSAVRPLNASISKLNAQEKNQHLYLFNWLITYRADDKREEILTIALDESGTRIPLAISNESAAEASDNILALDELLAEAEPVPVEQNEDGQFLPPKLPPMTQLHRLATTARKYATYHADVNCVDIESEIQPRLYKVLNRLHSYYRQQIEETYDSHDPAGEKRVSLEQDMQRKMAEEVENHRLRVRIELLSYAIFHVPVATAEITFSDGKQDVQVRVRRNLYSGATRRPSCHSCDQEITNIALDRNGHITCDDCLQQCATCMDVLCKSCGVEECPVCQQSNCQSCGIECRACGERACQDHVNACPICMDIVCDACQVECGSCGTRQCRTHLRADAVLRDDGSTALICAECAIRCPGCQQFSSQLDTCQMSGQRFCLNCLHTCTDCGKQIGPEYVRYDKQTNTSYCADCIKICPSCSATVPAVLKCDECDGPCCASCSSICAACNKRLCREDARENRQCGHVLCAEHVARCGIGNEEACPICMDTCAICERHYCEEHEATCALCRCSFCVECVRTSTGLCDSCASFERGGRSVYLADESIATHPDVEPLVHAYRWVQAENSRYRVYLGRGPYNTGALVLVQLANEEQEVEETLLVARKIHVLDQYWQRY